MLDKMIGHYKIIEQFVGDRGFYLAEDTRFDRTVVLRIFAAMSDDSSAREAFKREAIVASLLDHPNIRAVYGVDEFEGSPFIVLEHMDGITLETELSRGPVELGRLLEISIQITSALEALHSRDVIHGDVCPANIFLTVHGNAKLFNFGLASTPGVADEEVDPRNHRSAARISPEQLAGDPLGTTSDIFSFGTVLYEMLTGVSPFQKDTMEATVDAILTKKPARISKYRGRVPRLLKKTTAKMLAKNPAKRLASARELRELLEEVEEQFTRE